MDSLGEGTSTTRRSAGGKGERLKQVIVERISAGTYPVGARLPGVRAAAEEFGVHANTVGRIYGELADEGLVKTVHGSGTFVVKVPGEARAGRARAELRSNLHDLAALARQLGLSRAEWVELTSEAEAVGFSDDELTTWFVECSLRDSEELASSLCTLLGRHVRPLLTTELAAGGPASADESQLFVTTPFHLEEVEAAVGSAHQVVNVNVVPTSETLVQLAGLEPDARVTVLASNAATLERFVNMLHTYTRLDPVATAVIDDPQAPTLVREAEVLIDSQSIHEKVQNWRPTARVLTVRFQIEPTSVAYLREVLRRRSAVPG